MPPGFLPIALSLLIAAILAYGYRTGKQRQDF